MPAGKVCSYAEVVRKGAGGSAVEAMQSEMPNRW